MLILLPPSEGKTPPREGPPVDLKALSHPSLAGARRTLGDALIAVSRGPDALAALKVGPGLEPEVRANLNLWTAPADAAARVYSGVLYEASGAARWRGPELDTAARHVRIISAAWGALSPADAIPAYRLSMTSPLPGIGPLARWWQPALTPLLDEEAERVAQGGRALVVDCRSAPYAAAYRPSEADHVHVHVKRDVGGARTVVSHSAKHTRGLLVARLLADAKNVTSPRDVAEIAATMSGDGIVDVEVTAAAVTLVTA